MTDMTPTAWLWAAKGGGAAAGSALSLVYMLPKSRREAAARFAAGMIAGLVFGATAGLKIANELGVAGSLGEAELALMGSAAASLSAWWALGALSRVFSRIARQTQKDEAGK